MEKAKDKLTEIFDGGMDGVITVEEEADDPRSNAATSTGNAYDLTCLRHIILISTSSERRVLLGYSYFSYLLLVTSWIWATSENLLRQAQNNFDAHL